MSNSAIALSIAGRYTRSVHIQRDFSDIDTSIQGYQATPLVISTLQRIIASLEPKSKGRAFSIIGPYGSGKSAFGLFLAHYMQCTPIEREQLLIDSSVSETLSQITETYGQFLPIIVSGNNSSLRRALLQSLYIALDSIPNKYKLARIKELISLLKDNFSNKNIDPEQVATLTENINIALNAYTPWHGLIIIVDELGQHLDYAARERDDRDLFVLQTVAEMAARSGDVPCLLITILHQSFEKYAQGIGSNQRTEWAKVQGRFIDIPFNEPASQIFRMIARALAPQQDDALANYRQEWAETMTLQTEQLNLRPKDIPITEWETILYRSYPLHPMALLALPLLFRQLAQNERSLFAFLSNSEPWSFQDVLQTASSLTDVPPIYRLSHLYFYIESSIGYHVFYQSKGKKWAELAEARQGITNIDTLTDETLIIIGLLSSFGQNNLLKSSYKQISFAIKDTLDDDVVLSALENLQSHQHIIYRHYRDSYALFEGSDIDLESLIRKNINIVSDQMNYLTLIQEYTPITPTIVRRHSYKTGSVRYFNVQFTMMDDIIKQKNQLRIDGTIYYIIPTDNDTLTSISEWIQSVDKHDLQSVYVIPRKMYDIRDITIEIAAINRVFATEPLLENDRVARRELSSRLADAQQKLIQAINNSYLPEYSNWYWNGKSQDIHTFRDVDNLLSQICDEVFALTPRIWNELIVRRQLTAMGAKARRNLVEAMLDYGHVERLGLEGFPPERAIYESLFLNSGIHQQNDDNRWVFASPDLNNPTNIYPAWEAIERFFDQTKDAPLPIEELYTILEMPPYGVKTGMIPLLFIAVYLANAGELVLYEHGNYVQVPDITLFERLLRQPHYFTIRLSKIRGSRLIIYERITRALAPNLVNISTPMINDAVKPILRFVAMLPEFSKNTNRITNQAKNIRKAILNAQTPDQLLFNDLPEIFSLRPFSENSIDLDLINEFIVKIRETLTELQEALPTMVNELIEIIRNTFSVNQNISTMIRDELIERYRFIQKITSDTQIRAFGVRLETGGENNLWIESIGAFLLKKPVNTWNDYDIGLFNAQCVDLGKRFQELEQLALRMNPTDAPKDILRVGVMSYSGEKSAIVHAHSDNSVLDEISRRLQDVLHEYPSLTSSQQIQVLSTLLATLLTTDEGKE